MSEIKTHMMQIDNSQGIRLPKLYCKFNLSRQIRML